VKEANVTRNVITGMWAGLLIVSAGVAHAGAENAGTTAANFLIVGSDTRALSMGGTALGLGGGLSSVTMNSASLGFIGRTEFQLAHATLGGSTSQEWAAMGGRFGRSPMRWALTGLYQSEGTIDGRDASNNSIGSVDVKSAAFGATLAGAIGNHIGFGIGSKWVAEGMGLYGRGMGFTFDGGIEIKSGMFGLGATAQNVGGRMKYGSSSYPFPSSYGIGVGVTHPATGLTVGADLNMPNAYYKDVRGGVEWRYKDRFALRGGYRMEMGAPADEPLTGPAFGAGGGVAGVWLDYGYLIRGNGEGEHRIGLSFRPGFRLGDPFGQKNMPREFDQPIGPEPNPKKTPKKS
jgi:hypothetical protein